jgi:HEAT repeat protein
MAKDQLLALASDVDRILAAGASAAAGNDNLRKRGKTLRDLGAKVLALKPVADAIDKVLDAPAKQAGSSFLDLVGMTRQIRSSLTGPGVEGKLEQLPPSGPWQTPMSLRDLHPLFEALTTSGSGREEKLREGLERKATRDLRLLSPMLDSLNDGYGPLAELMTTDGLPSLGEAVAPEILAGLDVVHGKTPDTRRLQIACKLVPKKGAELCRQAIKEGSVAMRVKALELLPDVGAKGEAEKVGLELCDDKSAEVRAAAISALRHAISDEALDKVLAATKDKSGDVSRCSSATLTEIAHPQTTPRILGIVQELLTELEAAKPEKKKKDAKAKPAAKGKKAAKAETVQQKRYKLVSQISWWLNILGERKDDHRQEAARLILPLLEHKEANLRDSALLALGGIGAVLDGVLPAIIEALKDTKKGRSQTAANALARMEPAMREPAVPTVLDLLEKAKMDNSLRRPLMSMLPPHMGKYGPRILAILQAMLGHKDQWIRYKATEALAEVGPAARGLLPELLKELEQTNYYYRLGPIFATIDPEGKETIPQLIKRLSSRKREIRDAAMTCLRSYGAKARAAIPEINRLIAEEKEEWVRISAENTLAAIEGN